MDVPAIPKPRGLSSVGLSRDEEQQLFKAIFTLGKQGGALWRYTDMIQAAVLIVDTATPEGRAAAQQFRPTSGRALVEVERGLADPLHGRFVLPRPLTEASFVRAIAVVSDFCSAPSGGSDSRPPSPTLTAVPQAPAQDSSLIACLRNLLEEDGGVPAFIITGPGLSLVVSPKAKKVLADKPWDELKTFDYDVPVNVRDVVVGDPLLLRLVLDGQPLHYLLWLTGFHSGHGQLLAFLDRTKPYKLLRWPEFGTEEFTPQFLKVMSFLSKSAGTLEDVASWTGFARADVADLMNACELCGYLTTVDVADPSRTPAQPSEAAQEKRSLLNRIRQKLGMIQTGAADA